MLAGWLAEIESINQGDCCYCCYWLDPEVNPVCSRFFCRKRKVFEVWIGSAHFQGEENPKIFKIHA